MEIRPLRHLFLLAQLGSGVLSLIEPVVAAIVWSASLPILMAWSATAAANTARAKPSSRVLSAPSGFRAGAYWLAPALVVALWFVGVGVYDERKDGLSGSELDTLQFVGLAAAIAGVVAFVIALYLPYGYLRTTTNWAGGDGSAFVRWFWAPVVASLVGVALRVLLAMGIIARSNGSGTPGALDVVSGALIVATYGLPWIAYLIYAMRAMQQLERATTMTYERAMAPDNVAPHSLAAAYGIPEHRATSQAAAAARAAGHSHTG